LFRCRFGFRRRSGLGQRVTLRERDGHGGYGRACGSRYTHGHGDHRAGRGSTLSRPDRPAHGGPDPGPGREPAPERGRECHAGACPDQGVNASPDARGRASPDARGRADPGTHQGREDTDGKPVAGPLGAAEKDGRVRRKPHPLR
jgi:hypothetical protein